MGIGNPSGTPRISLAAMAGALMGVALPPSFTNAKFDTRLERQHPHFQQRPKANKKKRGR